jgi:hypothetical protein
MLKVVLKINLPVLEDCTEDSSDPCSGILVMCSKATFLSGIENS